MEINFFDKLDKTHQEAVRQLLTKNTTRITVLDEWDDDHLSLLLVRADTWTHGIIRFIVGHMSREMAAAFYYCDAPRARIKMFKFLKETNDET